MKIDNAKINTNATHSLTIDLVKSRKIKMEPRSVGEQSEPIYAKIDAVSAEKTFRSFMNALSKSLSSPGTWKRYKPQVKSVGSLEISNDSRWHFHISLTCPPHIRGDWFVEQVRRCAKRNPFIMNGEYSVKIDPLLTDHDRDKWVGYSLKNIERGKGHFVMS
jgi:hypothetical protein